MHQRAVELIAHLGLKPHPEGGYFHEVFRSALPIDPVDGRPPRAAMTTIYFLLDESAHSRWHQVDSDEVWHLYEGDGLELFELDATGTGLTRHRLSRLGDGGAPVHTVVAGKWQAARTLGAYALVGCTVAPGFDFDDFRLLAHDSGLATAVRAAWPDVASLI